MKRRISWLAVSTLVLSIGVACPGQEIAGATDQTATTTGNASAAFHSASGGYSISLPDGWTQIPDDKVQKCVAALVRSPQASAWQWDAAFQPHNQSEWFTYPYAIVQIKPYANGLEPTNAEIATALKEMAGINLDTEMRNESNPQVANLMSNSSLGQAEWDDKNKTARITMQTDVADAGTLKASGTIHFGRRAIVCVWCYATDADFGVQQATFRQISDSFQFDPGSEYNDGVNALTSQTARLSNGIFDGTGGAALRGILMVLMFSAVGTIGWVWKALKSRLGLASESAQHPARQSNSEGQKRTSLWKRYESLVFGLALLMISLGALVALCSESASCIRLALDGHETNGTVTAYRLVTTTGTWGQTDHHYHTIAYDGYSGELTLDRQFPIGTQLHVVYLNNDPSIFAVGENSDSIWTLIDSKIGAGNFLAALASIPVCGFIGFCLLRSFKGKKATNLAPASPVLA
jgi:hypothetical protein